MKIRAIKTKLLFLGIGGIIFCILMGSAPKKIEAPKNQQPNVLWILTDDQRYDAIPTFNRILHGRDEGELGYVESPNVDRLAEMGTTFINTFCHAQVCAPSRASMHYGRYPFRSGIYEFEYFNDKAEHMRPSIPESMAELGYQTLHIGKLGVRLRSFEGNKVFSPQIYQTDITASDLAKEGLCEWGKEQLFYVDGKKLDKPQSIEFFVTPEGKFEYISESLEKTMPELTGTAKNTHEKYDLLRHYKKGKKESVYSGGILGGISPQPAGKTKDASYATSFVKYLESENKPFNMGNLEYQGVDPSKPLFCHIGFDFPHTPVLPPADYRERFRKHTYKIPELTDAEWATMPKQLKNVVNAYPTYHFTQEEKQSMIQDYFAFCAYGDRLVGQAADAFIAYSEKNKQPWVIVYVCGDHGWKLNDHGSMMKNTPWEEDSHNPIIVVSSDKKAFPAGKVIKNFTEFVDIAPTILAAGGAQIKENKFDYLDGMNLAEVVSGKAPIRDYVIGESHTLTGPRAYIRTKNYAFSIQTRPNKNRGENITWALNQKYEDLDPGLYDLTKDPDEIKNLAFDEAYKEIAMKMKDKLLNIVLGDNRVEIMWGGDNFGENMKAIGTKVYRSNFAPGVHDYKLSL